ncbi:MAG: hypothetical protein R8K49_00635 [Mariprofundaceae bacterium]
MKIGEIATLVGSDMRVNIRVGIAGTGVVGYFDGLAIIVGAWECIETNKGQQNFLIIQARVCSAGQ